MKNKWDDNLFENWLYLRNQLKAFKKDKNWLKVTVTCAEIIQLDSKAKFIGIMVPIFYKESAIAYEKMNDFTNAINYYSLAKDGFIKHRNENRLANANDWIQDIDRIEEKIAGLLSKESVVK